MTFFHLENLRFSRVLRTRDRLARSGRHFIHRLLGLPCIAVDNRIGTLHNFLNTWSACLPLAPAATPQQLPELLERAATHGIGPTASP